MIVYQVGADGCYVGTAVADESPLEPGEHLIPAGCVVDPPPDHDGVTQRARWDGATWAVEAIEGPSEDLTSPPAPAGPIDLPAYAAFVRRQIEARGVGLTSGIAVRSDDESQGRVSRLIQDIDLGILAEPVNFKTLNGFVAMSRSDLVDVRAAIAQQIQRAFDAEEIVLAQITAGEIETLPQVDAGFLALLAPPDPPPDGVD